MNLFKQLRCKHEYKFYYKERIRLSGRMTPIYQFCFVCPKCEDKTYLKDETIEEVYKGFEKEASLNKILEKKIPEPSSILVPYALPHGHMNLYLTGPAATMTKNYFANYGIDITQIKED